MKHLFAFEGRQTAISMLYRVRNRLQEHKGGYVCLLLELEAKNHFELLVYRTLKDEIERRIGMGTCGSVDDWLVKQGIPRGEVEEHITEYRIRWVESMIKELE